MNGDPIGDRFDRFAGRRPSSRHRRRVLLVGAGLALTGVLAASILLWPNSRGRPRSPQVGSPRPTAPSVVGDTCSAQPPGCGSPQGTASTLVGMTWSAASAPPLSPRYGSTTVWTGRQLLVWGGVDDRKGETDYNNGAAYSPETRTWTAMPASPLSPRLNAFGVWTGSQALFWGGQNPSELMDGASYEPASGTWTKLPSGPLRPDHDDVDSIVWTGTQMVVIQSEQAAAYDPDAQKWSTVPALPKLSGWEPVGLSAIWTGTEVVAWVSIESHVANMTTGRAVVYAWTPGHPSWRALPASADDHWPGGTAAPDAGRVLFLGPGYGCLPGSSCGGPAFEFPGYWFDPSSSTESELPETFSGGGGPAVWTGSAMIVFGTKEGGSPSGLPNVPARDAAAFDPSTGAWTDLAPCPITDLGGVTLSELASLTWTGQQLIVLSTGSYPNGLPQMQILS